MKPARYLWRLIASIALVVASTLGLSSLSAASAEENLARCFLANLDWGADLRSENAGGLHVYDVFGIVDTPNCVSGVLNVTAQPALGRGTPASCNVPLPALPDGAALCFDLLGVGGLIFPGSEVILTVDVIAFGAENAYVRRETRNCVVTMPLTPGFGPRCT